MSEQSQVKWPVGDVDVPYGYERLARIYLEQFIIISDPTGELGTMTHPIITSSLDQFRAAEQSTPQEHSILTDTFKTFYRDVRTAAVIKLAQQIEEYWNEQQGEDE